MPVAVVDVVVAAVVVIDIDMAIDIAIRMSSCCRWSRLRHGVLDILCRMRNESIVVINWNRCI